MGASPLPPPPPPIHSVRYLDEEKQQEEEEEQKGEEDTGLKGENLHLSSKFPYLSQGFTKIFGKSLVGDVSSNEILNNKRLMQEIEDSERFQEYIHHLQHKVDCKAQNTKFYVMTPHPYGLGSQIHISAMSLLEAMVMNMTFIMPWTTRYVAPSRCKSQTWECSFMKISKCTLEDAFKAKKSQPKACNSPAVTSNAAKFLENKCSFIERRQRKKGAFNSEWFGYRPIINTLLSTARINEGEGGVGGGGGGRYGSLFVFREAVRYIIRPNPLMVNFTNYVRTQIKDLPQDVDMSQVMGVHIRHGEDKMKRPQYTAKDFATMIYQRLENEGRYRYVLLASNSGKAYKDLPKNLEDISRFKGIDFGTPKVVSVPGHFFSTIGTGDKNQDPFSTLKNHDSHSGHDEMMAMIAQLYILTSCGGFLGTLHHNFGQMVWELMSASRYTTLVNAHDMSGGVWFSGWVASGFPHGPLHFNPMGDTHL
mmetsp:Transcript_6579/g.10323  ORF Transcript_6579/g.10323 Transcript_6579/m.10323 type:complete len:478 (+) Transcript_6579:154-1587(+)